MVLSFSISLAAMPPRRDTTGDDQPPLTDLINQLISATNSASDCNSTQLASLIEVTKSLSTKIDSQITITANLVTHITTLSNHLTADTDHTPPINFPKYKDTPPSSSFIKPTTNTPTEKQTDATVTPTLYNTKVHVSGAGDFQLDKIELIKDPCSLNVKKEGDFMDADEVTDSPVVKTLLPLVGMTRKSVTKLCFQGVLTYFPGPKCKPPAIVVLQTKPEPPWEPTDPRYKTMSLEDKARFKGGRVDTVQPMKKEGPRELNTNLQGSWIDCGPVK